MKTLIVDNYDSFTFNLYQLIAAVNGEEPVVVPNDQYDWETLKGLGFDNAVISPGPGRPDNERDFGVCRSALREAETPILGVCLGHQGLGTAYGARVVHAPEVMHGRLSPIYHDGSQLFAGIPQGFRAVRYHSLIVEDDLPPHLEKIAWTEDGIIMGLRHRERPIWGVQFHPESICTEYGRQLLENFRELTRRHGLSAKDGRAWASFRRARACSRERRPAAGGDLQIYHRKLPAFYCSEQVFFHLFGQDPFAFWLDSSRAEPGLSRFSFLGGSDGPHSELIVYRAGAGELTVTRGGRTARLNQTIFDFLNRQLGLLHIPPDELPFDFNCGFVGYFGYELKAECGASSRHRHALPDAEFLLADRLVVFDHSEQSVYLLCLDERGMSARAEGWLDETERKLRDLPPLPEIERAPHPGPVTFRLNRPCKTYLDNIRLCQQYIKEGETYEVCLTNQICIGCSVDPLDLYRNLRRINPAPYAAYLRFNDVHILSSSPERFLRVGRDKWVESKPIKGTRPRGRTPEEDGLIREELQACPKDRSENLMIVDLLRNDLGRVCEVGSVHVPGLMQVETYETVHQLVSTIRGRLSADMSVLDCISCAFPGGSMTGAPKLRTMQIIDQFEQQARGIYSGAIGFLGLNGTADLNIVIRTIVMTPTCVSIGAGGAIVALSDPESEFQEMLLKTKALVHAIALTARGHFEPSQFQSFEEQITREGSATL